MDNFVKMMNSKAKELNLTATNFVNVYGLDAEGHKSSARDMAIIARELVKHDIILNYSRIYEAYLKKQDGNSLWMVNTNKLVRFYSGIDGLKTGYTSNAGYCLTATGKWGDMRLISVVMGEESQDLRTKDTLSLINYGKTTYKINKVIDKNKKLGQINLSNGKKLAINYYAKNDITDLNKITDSKKKYTYKIKTDSIRVPIKKGDKVGTIKVYNENNLIHEENLISKENITKCSFLTMIGRILRIVITGNY